MFASELNARNLVSDPERAISAKRGKPLSDPDLEVIRTVLTGPDGARFDRKIFSDACLQQASLLARLGTGALIKLGKEYYSAQPTVADAQAALVYVEQATAVLDHLSIDNDRLTSIAAAFIEAGHNDIALSIVKCTKIRPYLFWVDRAEA